jgi:hypothetical protein
MFITAIILAPLMLYAEILYKQGIIWPMNILWIFWIVCVFYTIAVTELNQTPIGIVAVLMFAPIFGSSIFILNRTKKWFQKYSVRA